MTFLAITHHPNGGILPIMNDDGETMAEYPTRAHAEEAMKNTMCAMAWGFELIDLDEL